MVKHGASVNAADYWKFTPLHEAAAKGKFDICKLLLKHGGDPTRKNHEGHTPLDLVKEGFPDVSDLLRGMCWFVLKHESAVYFFWKI